LNEIPGVKVSVAALLDEYSVQDVPEWAPLPVSLSPVVGPRAFGFSPALLPKLLDVDADIMHTHGIWQYPSMTVSRWHKRTGRPYLISPHGMLDPWAVRNSAWKKRIALAVYERRHLENASCIRALCDAEAQAIRQFGLHNPICIIPNGIDLPEDGGRMAEARGQRAEDAGERTDGRKILLYLGRIHPKKGLVNLLRAWKSAVNGPSSIVRRPSSDWILAIAGWDQGGHEDELKRLCDEMGITWADVRAGGTTGQQDNVTTGPRSVVSGQSSVVFLGPQFGDAKSACYRNCDAFILPSFSEGLPMVVLEAWAYGKPVLMTPQCNLPEGFAANAAIRIEPSAESIAQGLQEIFQTTSAERQALGVRGRALVTARFTWPKIASDMKCIYEWVLGGGPRPVELLFPTP
jgi:poly(glycerol-phosphate) alpha-glucosyltransferase